MPMRIINTSRRQRACYWPPIGQDNDGKATYGTPIECRVRWVDSTDLEFGDWQKLKYKSKVDFDENLNIQENGLFWKGKLVDVPVDRLTNPLYEDFGARTIVEVHRIPTIKADQEYCYALLA